MVAPLVIALIAAVVAVALTIIFMPKPKAPKPDENTDYDNPTAEAGRPYPVVFGTIRASGLNNVWFGDKKIRRYTITPGSGKK